MALDIWNLSIHNEDNQLGTHDHARKNQDYAGHFVENAAAKTSKNEDFDIWNLTNSYSKHPQFASLDVLDSKEVSLGTVASPQVHRAAAPRLADRLAEKQAETFCLTAEEKGQERKASGGNQTEICIKGESAAAVPPDALQGVPLSDQEREAIAAGLTPAQARRASEARVYTLEWILGLERMTQEQAESVASFRKMDAALISARGKIPYLDTLGIPRFPPDCEPKYRHWEGGQPLLNTLLELKAQDWAIDSRVTREHNPDDWRRWQEIKAARQAGKSKSSV